MIPFVMSIETVFDFDFELLLGGVHGSLGSSSFCGGSVLDGSQMPVVLILSTSPDRLGDL